LLGRVIQPYNQPGRKLRECPDIEVKIAIHHRRIIFVLQFLPKQIQITISHSPISVGLKELPILTLNVMLFTVWTSIASKSITE